MRGGFRLIGWLATQLVSRPAGWLVDLISRPALHMYVPFCLQVSSAKSFRS